MESSSRGGGRVWSNLYESHEMRRNGEKFSWDLKVLKIPWDDKIPWDFSLMNANAVTVSDKGDSEFNAFWFSHNIQVSGIQMISGIGNISEIESISCKPLIWEIGGIPFRVTRDTKDIRDKKYIRDTKDIGDTMDVRMG